MSAFLVVGVVSVCIAIIVLNEYIWQRTHPGLKRCTYGNPDAGWYEIRSKKTDRLYYVVDSRGILQWWANDEARNECLSKAYLDNTPQTQHTMNQIDCVARDMLLAEVARIGTEDRCISASEQLDRELILQAIEAIEGRNND